MGYASQTGTAHEIAKGIQAESASHGIKAKVGCLAVLYILRCNETAAACWKWINS